MIGTVIDLQLSWLVAESIMFNDKPDQEPTALPVRISAPTGAVPVMVKSAWVHAGLPASACRLNVVTVAVTAVTYTLLEFGLLKLPDNATVPPGARFVGETVWLTVIDDVVPVAALPDPVPVTVQ